MNRIESCRGCEFLHAVFVVPPLGGIEAATKPQVPIKTGTTNDATTLMKRSYKKSQPRRAYESLNSFRLRFMQH